MSDSDTSCYYAVTTLNFKDERRSRTVGCFPNAQTAHKCCRENWGDIYENGWYPYVVIEELEWGLYPNSISKRWFYKWDDGSYKKCEPPEGDKNIASYFG